MNAVQPLAAEHQAERSRFVVAIDGFTCVADYHLSANVMVMTHTFVPAELEGRGIASVLVRAAFDFARDHGYKVQPVCSYVAVWAGRHPDVADLLA